VHAQLDLETSVARLSAQQQTMAEGQRQRAEVEAARCARL
jgi:hypothetical protein